MTDEHADCMPFVLRELPNGTLDLSVCWDQRNVRQIAKTLREVADGLDELPEDHSGVGVKPL